MRTDRSPEILGLLCTLQSSFHVLPYRQLVEMLEHGLERFPGVASATLYIEAMDDEHREPFEPGEGDLVVDLRTLDGTYGWLELAVDEHCAFEPYRPFVKNLANSVATEIENRERAAALERAEQALRVERERLRRELEHKDEFLAMLGHELRNPLAAIFNAVTLQQSIPLENSLLERSRGIIDRQTQHMSRLVDDLLDVSRISRGKVQLERETLDVVELTREVATDFRSSIEHAGLEFRVTLADAPLCVHGDRTRLAQILGNLLDNAIKFTEAPGTIELGVRCDSAQHQAVIWVRDTGIGVADEHLLETLFAPFGQAPGGRDKGAGGLGLGLSLVKALAETHGGRVEAESDGADCGATFTVRLPLRAQPANAQSEESAQPETKVLRCLVIDDEVDVADTLGALLEVSGHQVAIAYSGPEALAAIDGEPPDLILCDIGLGPPMDGYELAERFSTVPALEASVMVAVTGYGGDEARRRAMEAGFDHHLTKPVKLADIMSLLD